MKRKVFRAADLFCGAGGASNGLVQACERSNCRLELIAINHWNVAVETHSANHPGVTHLCEDLESVNPRKVVPGGHLDLLLAGPECTHHSTARGGKPMNDQSRASAWCVLRWATALQIDTILVENVRDFLSWAPLGSNGRPLKSRKGETFRAYIEALRSLGYRVDWKILNAADYGDPTTRERLFIQARRGRRPIVWPQPTHSHDGEATLFGKTERWRPAREIIDWTIPGESIFGRKRPLSPNTLARIAAGLKKFGGKAAEPFLVLLNSTDPKSIPSTAKSLDDPVPTVTGSPHLGLCQPLAGEKDRFVHRCGLVNVVSTSQAKCRKCGSKPFPYPRPFLVPTNYGERLGQAKRCHDIDKPMPTVVGSITHGLVEPFLVAFKEGIERRVHSVDKPLLTQTTCKQFGLVEPFMLGQQSGSSPRSVEHPVPTVATDGAIALVEPFIVSMEHSGANGKQVRSVDQPLPTVTTRGDLRVCEPYIVPTNHGETNGGNVRAYPLDRPMPTITTVDAWGLIEPFIVPNNANNVPKSLDDPVPTVTGANRLALVEPFLTRYHNNRPEVCARSVDEPLPTADCNDRYGLVSMGGSGAVIDIRFRMLQPHELAQAMSFPKDYVFRGTREQKVKQIGNAWAGRLSAALCQALLDS